MCLSNLVNKLDITKSNYIGILRGSKRVREVRGRRVVLVSKEGHDSSQLEGSSKPSGE